MLTLSKSGTEIGLFEIPRMFYSPNESPKGAPIESTWCLSILLCSRDGFDTFKICQWNRPFWNPPNVLFTDGMGWMDGRYQKCPSIFFILTTTLCTSQIYVQSLSKTLWFWNFAVMLGVRELYFWNYHIHVTFQIWGSKVVFFFFLLIGIHCFFFENLKNVFSHVNWKKFRSKIFTFFLFFINLRMSI